MGSLKNLKIKMMTKKYKILSKFVKDMSSETKDIETYLFVKERISKYKLGIDITSRVIKNKIIEVSTTIRFQDNEDVDKKSYFEIIFLTILKIEENVTEKKDLEKIILCDVQNEIYKDLEKAILNLLQNSGYPVIKLEKKIDFENLYKQKTN